MKWFMTLGGLLLLAATSVAKDKPETCSGDFGTAIQFLDTPQEAAQAAKKDGKLVFVLHVSGHFEKPEFT
jgi:hypothetical protein